MLKQEFEGKIYGYTYSKPTEVFLLYNKEDKIIVLLKGDNAFMFREHLELINIEQNDTLNERTEKVIKIHYDFETKPCPFPKFIKE